MHFELVQAIGFRDISMKKLQMQESIDLCIDISFIHPRLVSSYMISYCRQGKGPRY